MKTVKINEEGYLEAPDIQNASIEIEVSDEEFEKIQTIPFYQRWKYINGKFDLVDFNSDAFLRHRRDKECFRIIDNRSYMWYENLTEDQKRELKEWYNAWLVVTETKVIPVKPEWLKD